MLIVDSDGRTLAARGLDTAEPGVATAANHALVDAPASPWARILPWDTTPPPGHRGRPARRRTGRRRRGGGRHLHRGTRCRASAGCGWRSAAWACWCWPRWSARALTRWVLRPLNGLERAVAEMTEGRRRAARRRGRAARTAPLHPAFNTMAQVVRASLDRQRRLVADASHQLRNPLAAVRLRADTLEDYVAEAGRPTYGSMTAELDRFENLLQQLLRLARAEQVSGSRQVGLSDRGDGVDGPRRRDRRTGGVLAARRRRAEISNCATARTSRARGSARPPRRRAAARRRAGQRAALRRGGHHGHRVGRAPRTTRSIWSSATTAPACPRRTWPGPPRDSGGDATTAPGPASDWRSPPRSRRATAGRSRWSGRPRAVCWSATACRWRASHVLSTDRPK